MTESKEKNEGQMSS